MDILHLSDFHYGDDHKWNFNNKKHDQSLVEQLDKTLGDERPSVLIICGDFVGKGSDNEYKIATKEIEDFLEKDSLKNLERILFVPGNHDVVRNVDGSVSFDNYRKFRNDVLENFEKKKSNRRTKPELKIPDYLSRKMDDHNMDFIFFEDKISNINHLIIGLNTIVSLPSDESELEQINKSELGYFGQKQLTIFSELCEYVEKMNKDKEIIKSVVFHHHIVSVGSVDIKYLNTMKTSIIADARDALEQFRKNNVSFIYHGHGHQHSSVTICDNLAEYKKNIHIIASGGVGVKREKLQDSGKNHFYLHKIDQNSINTTSYLTDERGFFRFVGQQEKTIYYSNLDILEKNGCYIHGQLPKEFINACRLKNQDSSDLFYLFLRVEDCQKSRNFIKEICEDQKTIRLEGVYDLYGHYDTLVKYRAETTKFSSDFSKLVNEKLIHIGEKPKKSGFHVLDINNEIVPAEDSSAVSRVLFSNMNGYEQTVWNIVFIELSAHEDDGFQGFIDKILIREGASEITNKILRSISYFNNGAIFELLIGCNHFPLFTKFSRIIESCIVDHEARIRKHTYIAYGAEETPSEERGSLI